MPILSFNISKPLSLGAEIELQIIHPCSQALVSRSKELMRRIRISPYQALIKPEITQSMIELNSSVHQTPQSLHLELLDLGRFLKDEGDRLEVQFSGGGTHPFQKWSAQKIYPSARFKTVSSHYRYLAKRFTVFALHFHIGCPSGDEAIYLAHMLSRFVPHFIALSAASPFYQGADTGFNSSRLNVVNAFPTSGSMPFVLNWREFSEYYLKLRQLKIVRSMKDIYWDIRPKPQFGTVEVRVCDTPLTLHQVATIVAYAQTLSSYLLMEKPFPLTKDLYFVYAVNRFQACRYGYEGNLIDPFSLKNYRIDADILETLKRIKSHAKELNTEMYLKKIQHWVQQQKNGSTWQRQIYAETASLEQVMALQCEKWRHQFLG